VARVYRSGCRGSLPPGTFSKPEIGSVIVAGLQVSFRTIMSSTSRRSEHRAEDTQRAVSAAVGSTCPRGVLTRSMISRSRAA
jgi:hypothetical protein